jgi:hypothetical protein
MYNRDMSAKDVAIYVCSHHSLHNMEIYSGVAALPVFVIHCTRRL